MKRQGGSESKIRSIELVVAFIEVAVEIIDVVVEIIEVVGVSLMSSCKFNKFQIWSSIFKSWVSKIAKKNIEAVV